MRTTLILAGALAIGACRQEPAPEPAPANDAVANSAAPAAPAIPDLKGTWVGTSESIFTGLPKHHEAQRGDRPWRDEVEFTYAIEGQDGRRFWGTLTSPNFEEDAIGVVALDGKTIVARTSEGEVRGTLVDPDTIDLTYSAGGSAPVVAVNTWKRQR